MNIVPWPTTEVPFPSWLLPEKNRKVKVNLFRAVNESVPVSATEALAAADSDNLFTIKWHSKYTVDISRHNRVWFTGLVNAQLQKKTRELSGMIDPIKHTQSGWLAPPWRQPA